MFTRFKKRILSKISQDLNKQVSRILSERSHDLKYGLQLKARDETVEFILERNYPLERTFANRLLLLDEAINHVTINNGLILEFGVYKGETISRIADRVNELPVFGFDSFEGLNEPWIYRDSGAFSDVKGTLPNVPHNVTLIKGFFNETMEEFLKNNLEKVNFLHIDSDLYSSADYVLHKLEGRLDVGSVIVFDEYFNYPGWQRGEHKAWEEFIERTSFNFDVIGFTYQRTNEHKSGNQVAFKLK